MMKAIDGSDRRIPQPLLKALWLVVLGLVIGTRMASAGADQALRPNRLLVLKSERTLFLMRDNLVLKSYQVSLGKNPVGDKVREGDARTPEGIYVIDWKKPDSEYYRALHISYPSREDRRRARALGVSPGGAIMLHGFPNDLGPLVFRAKGRDWTLGCIAVSNKAMDELWDIVAPNTRIEIFP